MSKILGSAVISGSLNGETAIVIRADKHAIDSRYANIMAASEQHKPRMRRMADQLGAWYTPLAVAIRIADWITSGDPMRFYQSVTRRETGDR